jgi:hypothetical protein
MRSGTHARDDGSFGRSAGTQTLKGAALIVVALIIGLVLLRTAPRAGTTVISGGVTAQVTKPKKPHSGTGSTVAPPSTTTVPPAHPASQVSVVVANGSGVTGLAGRIRGQLNTAGYSTTKPAINSPTQVATTAIYFTPGYEADAVNVAHTLQLTAGNVFPMPSTSPVPATYLTDVQVLVIAGSDIGNSTSETTEAPAGDTIAPTPTEASGGSTSGGSSGQTSTTNP